LIAVVCVDDRNGMLFHNRRLSRDRLLCEDIIRCCGMLWVKPEAAALFADHTDCIHVAEDCLRRAGSGEFCFVEDDPLEDISPEGLILYRWNRRYPADVHLAFSPEEHGMTLLSREDFPGSTHPRITREIWRYSDEQRKSK